ncbi:MAG: hypothetical protein WKF34_07280 [Pyrinomonadaceae bacterium]
MKKSIVFLVIFISIAFSMTAKAQTNEVTSKDVRLVKDLPNVYVSFEREGNRKPLKTRESNKGVWLRFHNNSKWRVGVCMWDVPKEYGDKDITYEVERYKNVGGSVETPIANDPEGSCPREYIESGKSVLFSVPREHLAKGLAIKVQFRYEWEDDPDGFANPLEPTHYAYFYSSDISKMNGVTK